MKLPLIIPQSGEMATHSAVGQIRGQIPETDSRIFTRLLVFQARGVHFGEVCEIEMRMMS